MQLSATSVVALLVPMTSCGPKGTANLRPTKLLLGSNAHLAFDRDGRGLLVEPGSSTVSWMNEAGRAAGSIGKFGIEPGQFNNPVAAAFDRNGIMYVLDRGNHRVQVFDLKGQLVSVLGKGGSGEGEFLMPAALTFDSRDRLLVADALNHRVSVWQDGKYVGSFGELGTDEGQLNNPRGIATWPDDSVWVLDQGNNRIATFSAEGRATGTVQLTGKRTLRSLAVSGDGRAFISDLSSSGVMVFDQRGSWLETQNLSKNGRSVLVSQLVTDSWGDVHAATSEVL